MNYALALEYAYPGMQWSIQGNDYSTLVWHPGNAQAKPTEPELQTAYTNYQTSQTNAGTALSNIISTAQSAVGVTLTALTAAQQRSLLAVLIHKAGGVDISNPNQPKVKPLNQWANG